MPMGVGTYGARGMAGPRRHSRYDNGSHMQGLEIGWVVGRVCVHAETGREGYEACIGSRIARTLHDSTRITPVSRTDDHRLPHAPGPTPQHSDDTPSTSNSPPHRSLHTYTSHPKATVIATVQISHSTRKKSCIGTLSNYASVSTTFR